MAARRQDAWEAALKEKAFLSETIKPIVDDTATFKPPIPYALREVKRSMDKGIRFKNNTYGLAGIAGDPHTTALREYGDWAQWAQIPVGNVAERNEGLSNNPKSFTWYLTSRSLALRMSAMTGVLKRQRRFLSFTRRTSSTWASFAEGQ